MTKIYSRFINRKEKTLTGFSSADNSALLSAICSNSATGHVRQLVAGGAVSVPSHAADAVEAHLNRCGWALAVAQ